MIQTDRLLSCPTQMNSSKWAELKLKKKHYPKTISKSKAGMFWACPFLSGRLEGSCSRYDLLFKVESRWWQMAMPVTWLPSLAMASGPTSNSWYQNTASCPKLLCTGEVTPRIEGSVWGFSLQEGHFAAGEYPKKDYKAVEGSRAQNLWGVVEGTVVV